MRLTWPAPADSFPGSSRLVRSTAALACALAVAAALWAAGHARAADPAAVDCSRPQAASMPADRAPRVVLLQGALGIVTMAPMGEFLAAMGYPPAALADPRTGEMTTDSDLDGRTVAGMLAWHYEREGVRPVIVGHSKGGGVVIDTLRALAGAYGDDLALVDPRTHAALPRTRFLDPVTGESQRVVDLKVPFASAIATGRLPRILRGQFELASVLRDVPDSVERFTGFAIPYDPIAGTLAGDEDPYRSTGRAVVRNVVLPATTSHIGAPLAAHLARDPATRAWVESYLPGVERPMPEGADTTNLLQAAELWYSIRRAWCEETLRGNGRVTRAG